MEAFRRILILEVAGFFSARCLVFGLVLLTSAPAGARGQPFPGEGERSCLDVVRQKVPAGVTLNIERVDGGKVRGRLLSINQAIMTISRQSRGFADSVSFPLTEVRQIEFREKRKLRLGYTIAGFVGGFLFTGFTAGDHLFPIGYASPRVKAGIGVAAVATTLSLLFPQSRRIECSQ